MLDILFTSHNRLAFAEQSFATLKANTDWANVRLLHVLDDGSTDGTADWLATACNGFGCPVRLVSAPYNGAVGALNDALDHCESELLAKIDSDLIVCPGWLDAMLAVLEWAPTLDALGMEPGFGGSPTPADAEHGYRKARWIGGQGVFRTRVFASARPRQEQRWFGLTAFWRRYARTAWIAPDLPIFNLDHLPLEPWQSLARSYVSRGWSRAWTTYPPEWSDYWNWWLTEQIPAATDA